MFQTEPSFLMGPQVTFYVDKINILYYLISWTIIIFQGPNSLQIIRYMHALPPKFHTEAKLRTGEWLLSLCLWALLTLLFLFVILRNNNFLLIKEMSASKDSFSESHPLHKAVETFLNKTSLELNSHQQKSQLVRVIVIIKLHADGTQITIKTWTNQTLGT